jgi:WD repeat-containing protein 35
MLSEEKLAVEVSAMDNIWRGAEAYHYYILAQKQFYQGMPDAAVITCTTLCQYQDIIDPVKIFSLMALAGIHSSYFYSCAKSLAKLESLKDSNAEKYSELVYEIFSK